MEAFKMTIFILASLSHLISTEGHGRWKLLKRNMGISAMHVALLPNGKLVAYDRTTAGRSNISLPNCDIGPKLSDCTAHSVEFDPITRAVRPLTLLTDTFCSSGSLSANGTLIQSGGYLEGDHVVRYFTPCDDGCDWIEEDHGLLNRRWYATDQVLPDGRIFVVGGRKQFNYEFIPKTSSSEYVAFDLQLLVETTDKWENNLYPFVHLAPDGNLFIFANTKSILLDYINHCVVRAFPEIPGGIARNYPSTGSSVLLPLILDANETNVAAEVMICGGTVPTSNSFAMNGTFIAASSTCGRLKISEESPVWEMEEMPIRRVMGDMVLLPTGDVLIVNGAMNGSAGWEMAREPALCPILYRTGITCDMNKEFEVMSPSSTPRLYHSTAILVPDGRVIIGGSNPHQRYEFSGVMFPTELSLEAFYPPYLDPNLPRPVITSIGDCIGYGERVPIEFLAKKRIRGEWEGVNGVRVTMVAPTFNTHSFGMHQRVLVLGVEGVQHIGARNYTVNAVAPATKTVAPPGYYMVFVVHGGVPSRGEWVRIKN